MKPISGSTTKQEKNKLNSQIKDITDKFSSQMLALNRYTLHSDKINLDIKGFDNEISSIRKML